MQAGRAKLMLADLMTQTTMLKQGSHSPCISRSIFILKLHQDQLKRQLTCRAISGFLRLWRDACVVWLQLKFMVQCIVWLHSRWYPDTNTAFFISFQTTHSDKYTSAYCKVQWREKCRLFAREKWLQLHWHSSVMSKNSDGGQWFISSVIISYLQYLKYWR